MSNLPRRHHASRQWLQLVVQATLGLLLFAFVLILGQRFNQRYDMTPDQQYVLPGEVQRIVASVQQPVSIKVFYDGQQQGYRRALEDRLRLFADANPQVSYRLIDLDRNPREAERYEIGSYNTGIVETESGLQRLRAPDEESIAAAILRLTQTEAPVVCFVTGHGEQNPELAGERSGYSAVAKALEKENYVVRSVEWIPEPEAGRECNVLVVAGPRQELLPREIDYLMQRLQSGGAILLLVEPDSPASIETFLARVGIRVFNDLIVDERSRFYGADAFSPRVRIIDTETFGDRLGDAIFAVARTLRPAEGGEVDASMRLLALTGEESWARIGDEELPDRDISFREDIDKPGPLPVGAVVRTRRPDENEPGAPAPKPVGPMIIFGDSDFANNLYLDLFGNRDLFLSTIAALSKQDVLVARRRERAASNFSVVTLTDEQITTVFRAAVLWPPLVVMLLGIGVLWLRRRRTST